MRADIQAGQGLYYETITKTWRAVNCNTNNNYGVANKTYGLTPAGCKSCPANMIASRSANYSTSAAHYTANADGTGGFTSVLACVTVAGGVGDIGRLVVGLFLLGILSSLYGLSMGAQLPKTNSRLLMLAPLCCSAHLCRLRLRQSLKPEV